MNLNFRVAFLLCLAATAAIVIVMFGGSVEIRRKYAENDIYEPTTYLIDDDDEAPISGLDKCDMLRFTLAHGKYAGNSYILDQESNNKSHNASECTIPVVLNHGEKEECGEKCANFNNVIIFDFVRSKIVLNSLGINDIDIPKVLYLPANKQLGKILPLGMGDHFEILHGRANALERILKCFKNGMIPVITSKNLTLPFSRVLEWDNALIRTSKSQDSFGSNYGLTEAELFELKRVGFLIYQRYFSTKERFVDFALAVIKNKLGQDPPFHQDVVLDHSPIDDNFLPPKLAQPFPMTAEESRYLWNVAFFPWKRTPTNFLRQSDHRMDRYVSGDGGQDNSEQFTVVCMTYTKTYLLRDMVEMFKGMKQVKAVIVLWNNLGVDPDQDSNISKLLSAVPEDNLPTVVVARSTKNSLNNRMLPLELITTDCVFQVDDDTRHLKPESILSGFRVWQKNRDNLVGYQSRHAKMGKKGKWEYSNSGKEVSIILTTAAFHHKFFSYKYTYEMLPPLLSKVDELMNCEDIFLNGLVQAVTGLAPLMAEKNSEYSCGAPCERKGQDKGLHNQSGHYRERADCVNLLEKYFGYLPLIETKLVTKSL